MGVAWVDQRGEAVMYEAGEGIGGWLRRLFYAALGSAREALRMDRLSLQEASGRAGNAGSTVVTAVDDPETKRALFWFRNPDHGLVSLRLVCDVTGLDLEAVQGDAVGIWERRQAFLARGGGDMRARSGERDLGAHHSYRVSLATFRLEELTRDQATAERHGFRGKGRSVGAAKRSRERWNETQGVATA